MVKNSSALSGFSSSEDVVDAEWTVDKSSAEVIGNCSIKILFSINQPASRVWKIMEDLSAWQADLQYDRIADETCEGRTLSFGIKSDYQKGYSETYGIDAKQFKKLLIAKRIVPEKLVVFEELAKDGRTIAAYYLWALYESGGSTTVAGLMAYPPRWQPIGTEEEMRRSYRSHCSGIEERWRSLYIPTLRRLVESG